MRMPSLIDRAAVVRRRAVGRGRRRPSPSRTRPTSRSVAEVGVDPARRDRAGRSSRPGAASTRACGPTCPPTERAARLHAFLDHVDGDEGRPRRTRWCSRPASRAASPRARSSAWAWAWPASTIDLYLSMPHEEPNPVPVDELVPGRVALSVRRHEPVGVVAASRRTTAAIIMAFQKLVPALLAGNSVILRPSPLTPISSLVFGAAADAAGIPPGVLSVVVEEGAAGAELLTTHPAVDMVSFTGSTAVGRQILAQAAPTVKRVTLELGGKSAQIYLDDAVDLAPLGAMVVVAMTAGPGVRGRHPDARAEGAQGRGRRRRSATCTARITVGAPDRPGHPDRPGDQRRRARAVRAVRRPGRGARRQGRLRRRPAGRASTGATTSSRPCSTCPTTPTRRPSDEIFGPVIGVIGYDDVDDAVAHRQRQPLRAVGPGVRRRRRRRHRGRPAAPDRRRQREHVAVQRLRARRRLQAERPRPRARPRGDPRVPGGQAHGDRRADE